MQRLQEDQSSGGGGGKLSPGQAAGEERVEVVVELDPDVAARILALGPNWQDKVNAILKMAKV
jgi:uncharacterized protein (DUF4415 family)